jgi:hypothetical protein
VYSREPKGIAQFSLGHGKLETVILRQSNSPQAQEHLTEQVSRVLKGRAPTHRHNPLAVDGCINGKVDPKQTGKMRVVLGDPAEDLVRDPGDRAGRDSQDSVVHLLYQEAVQINEVAGYMKGRDLALAVPEEIVARGKAFQQKSAVGRAIPLPENVLTFAHDSGPDDSPLQQLSFLVRKAVKVLKFADQAGVQDEPPWGSFPAPSAVSSPVGRSIAKLMQEGRARLNSYSCMADLSVHPKICHRVRH